MDDIKEEHEEQVSNIKEEHARKISQLQFDIANLKQQYQKQVTTYLLVSAVRENYCFLGNGSVQLRKIIMEV